MNWKKLKIFMVEYGNPPLREFYSLRYLQSIDNYSSDELLRLDKLSKGEVMTFTKPLQHTISYRYDSITIVDDRYDELDVSSEVYLQVNKYTHDSNLYIGLISVIDDELWADVTVNNGSVPEGWIRIKDYTEGERMPELMLKNGIVTEMQGSLGKLHPEVLKMVAEIFSE